jgi:hypothetical protein
MVLFHALTLSIEKDIELKHLISWTTVGTPFIFYKVPLLRVIRVHWYTFVLVLLAFLFRLRVDPPLHSFPGAAITAAILVVTLHVWARAARRRADSLESQAVRRYGSRWIGIRSRHDEAIALLRTALRLSLRVVPAVASGTEVVLR